MRQAKSLFGVIGAFLPVLYCGGLAYYFLDLTGSPQDAQQQGLGPTVLGLITIGLLFCIPLVLKVIRLIAGPHSPGSDGADGPDDKHGGGSGFDADAAIARYLANQSAAGGPLATRAPSDTGPTQRPSFGRKLS